MFGNLGVNFRILIGFFGILKWIFEGFSAIWEGRILKGFSGFLKDFLKRFHVKEHQFIPVVSC